ncbi:MAG: nitroreductase family protein [Candidatus Omnitrophica bacterium]|nr:nitroreductase family protein [Candidatus Omnitrophota bacterium]
MNMLLDKKLCNKDGLCAKACPIEIIVTDPSSGFPSMVEWGPKACISCGHCVAICPTGALSLDGMNSSECRELKIDWRVAPDKIEEFLKGRRSIRRFKETSLDRASLEKLIDIARYAPSGINRQPVCWAVISGREKVREVAGLTIEWMRSLVKDASPLAESLRMENIIKSWERGSDPITRGAPNLVIAYSLKDDMTAPAACTIALTYLEIAAASFGFGACWAGYVHMALNMSPEVNKLVGLSKRTSSFGAMLLGYQAIEYRRIPGRNRPHIIWR